MPLDQPVDGGSMDAQVFGNLVHRHHLAPFRMAQHLGATLPFHLKARESLAPLKMIETHRPLVIAENEEARRRVRGVRAREPSNTFSRDAGIEACGSLRATRVPRLSPTGGPRLRCAGVQDLRRSTSGSAWRCTRRHRVASRRKNCVTRRDSLNVEPSLRRAS